MNERYDVDGTGRDDGGGPALDVRALLEDASWTGRHELLDPHEHWSSGRRRRSRKRAGAGVLGGVALVAVAGLVLETGVFGGEAAPLEPRVAHLPSGLTTFVLAGPDAGPGGAQEDGAAVQVADPEALVGTSWELTDQVWRSDESAALIVGSEARTVFSFAGQEGRGWGFSADDCGGGWFQDDLRLTADGAFAGGDLGTTDVGCPGPAQTAEDFWMDVLAGGGTLHTLDHDWLLLSVDPERAEVQPPPPVVIEDATRLVFVRPGTDPGSAEPTGPERVPANEELAGSRWQLAEGGAGALTPWLQDPARLQLAFADGWPASLSLDYGDCQLARLRTEGVDNRGATVPVEGLDRPAEPGPEPCPGAEEAGPFLAEALGSGAQVTLVGDRTLVLRVALPIGEGATPTPGPAATTATQDEGSTGVPAPSTPPSPPAATPPAVAPTGPTAAPTAPPSAAPTAPAPTPSAAVSPSAPGNGAVLDGFSPPDQVVASANWPDSQGAQLFAPTVRAGLNAGFDRVVVDLTGQGVPSWWGSYPEVAVRDGSGLPMQIAGDSVLELVITGMAYPDPGDPVYDGGDFGLDTHRLVAVQEVIRTPPFEGQLQLFIGMQGAPRPYRVFLLQDPMRLVVDVQHAG